MRRVLIVMLFLILIGLNGCSSSKKIEHLFESFNAETNKNIPYVHHNTFVFDDITLDFDALLKENGIVGAFHEVYVVQDNIIYFGYSEMQRNSGTDQVWHIATITIGQSVFNSVFSADFCLTPESDQHYIRNSNEHLQNRYTSANGFYHDNKIVLTDHIKLIEFDIKTRSAVECDVQSYDYPAMPLVEIVDSQIIYFSNDSQQKIFGENEGAQTSVAFNEMLELRKRNNWKGDSLLSDLFSKVQIVDDQTYIICRVMNWNGETYAVVYQYDFENNSCQYAFHCYMDDLITNNLYVVPYKT